MLVERALALAVVPPRPPSASEMIDVAVFSIADERYAVETRYVRRVVKPDACTPVPGTPSALRGLINVHGEVLAVFDLPTALGVGRGAACDGTFVVVLGVSRDELGVAADAVHEVRSLRGGELLDPPGALEGVGRSLLLGITADALLVLDGGALLADDRLVIDQGEDAGG